jgi:hypothetical protein
MSNLTLFDTPWEMQDAQLSVNAQPKLAFVHATPDDFDPVVRARRKRPIS